MSNPTTQLINSVMADGLTRYEFQYVRKQVRYLLTAQGLVDWRRNRAVWQAEWPPVTDERKAELDQLAATFVRPRVKR